MSSTWLLLYYKVFVVCYLWQLRHGLNTTISWYTAAPSGIRSWSVVSSYAEQTYFIPIYHMSTYICFIIDLTHHIKSFISLAIKLVAYGCDILSIRIYPSQSSWMAVLILIIIYYYYYYCCCCCCCLDDLIEVKRYPIKMCVNANIKFEWPALFNGQSNLEQVKFYNRVQIWKSLVCT